MVKWLGLRARGHRFESGQEFLGSFGLIFEVIVGWCPTRPEFFLLSQIFRGHVRVVFMLLRSLSNYLPQGSIVCSHDPEIFTLVRRRTTSVKKG